MHKTHRFGGAGRVPLPGWSRAGARLLVVAALLAGCGGGAETTSTASPTAPATAASPTSSPAPSQEPTSPASPTSPTSDATAQSGESRLPGEQTTGPEAGSTLAVVGVAADDVLNVRDVPGIGGQVIGELDPLADDVEVTGRARTVDRSVWWQIEGGAVEDGWVNARYLAWLGDTTDVTSELEERPGAGSLEELADAVAELRAPFDAEGLDVVVSAGPTVGDLGEITVDLVGFPDDAVRGERLHLFAVVDEGDQRFTLRTVERTLLCSRGVSDGLCL